MSGRHLGDFGRRPRSFAERKSARERPCARHQHVSSKAWCLAAWSCATIAMSLLRAIGRAGPRFGHRAAAPEASVLLASRWGVRSGRRCSRDGRCAARGDGGDPRSRSITPPSIPAGVGRNTSNRSPVASAGERRAPRARRQSSGPQVRSRRACERESSKRQLRKRIEGSLRERRRFGVWRGHAAPRSTEAGTGREPRRDCDADVGEESGIAIIRNRRLTRSPGESRRAT